MFTMSVREIISGENKKRGEIGVELSPYVHQTANTAVIVEALGLLGFPAIFI